MKRKFVLVFIFMFVVELIGIQEKANASSPAIIKVEAGYAHNIALKEDGTVWTWGYNISGQLGDGTNTNRSSPVQVSGLSGIIDVDAGASYSVALKNDGTVWAWGRNYDCELGDGTTSIGRYTPAKVSGLSGIVDISCSNNFTFAIKNNGTVWAWGNNEYGQLGDGTTTNGKFPVQVKIISNVIAIETGRLHTIALTNDGTVWAWGDNGNGQLGDGTQTNSITPVAIMSGVSSIGAGAYYSLAIKNDGTVWSWGYNFYGQLGDGTYINKLSPNQMIGATDVKSIIGGYYHTIVLKNDGTVWVCGRDLFGELGDGIIYNGRSNSKSALIKLSGISGARTVSAGDGYTIVLLQDGSVWGCGINKWGQLGD